MSPRVHHSPLRRALTGPRTCQDLAYFELGCDSSRVIPVSNVYISRHQGFTISCRHESSILRNGGCTVFLFTNPEREIVHILDVTSPYTDLNWTTE